MIQSTDSFVKQLFPPSTAKKNGGNSKKLALISISGKFKVCISLLFHELHVSFHIDPA